MFTSGDAFRDFNFKHLHSCFFFGYYGLWWIYVEYSWSWAGKIGALSIQPNRSKMWKQRQMAQKFPGKVSRNSGNCWISEMRTIQPKILEIPGDKLNGKKTSGKKISTVWVYLARLSSFWKFLKMLFHSLLEVVKNSNWKFWLNGVMVSPLSNTGVTSAIRCGCPSRVKLPWLPLH